jgi:hypothetical protein
MGSARILKCDLGTVAWGLIFLWWGITELFKFLPDGTGMLGIGLILLGVNAVRSRNGIPTNSFSITLGILALVWGGLDLARSILHLSFDLPVFAILLIVLGVILLTGELRRGRETTGEALG